MRTFFIVLGLFLGTLVGVNGQSDVKLDSLKRELGKNLNLKDRITCYAQISHILINQNNPDYIKYNDTLKQIGYKENNQYAKGYVNKNIATVFALTGNLDSAKFYFHITEQLFEKEYKQLYATKINLGLIYNKLGRKTEAIQYYQECINFYSDNKSLAVISPHHSKEQLSIIYSNLGVIYENIDMNDKAIDYYYKSLNIREAIKDTQGMVITATNISAILIKQRSFKESEKYLKIVLENAKKINDEIGIADYYTNTATIYAEQGTEKYDQAISFYEKSISIYKKTNNSGNLAFTYKAIADIYIKMEDFDKATINLQMALDIINKNKFYTLLPNLYISLGEIEIRQKRFIQGIHYLDTALFYSKKIKNRESEMFVYKNYSRVYKQTNDNRLALDYLEKYNKVLDSVYNDKSQKHIANLNIGYQTSKKELEIQQQKQVILEQKQAELQQFYVLSAVITGLAMLLLVLLLVGIILWQRRESRNKLVLQEQKTKAEQKQREIDMQYTLSLENVNKKTGSALHVITHDVKQVATQIKDIAPQATQRLSEIAMDLKQAAEKNYLPDVEAPLVKIFEKRCANNELMFQKKGIKIITNFNIDEKKLQLSSAVKTAYCRVLENALSNIDKHSQATTATIKLFYDEEGLMLQVQDNGIGFDMATINPNIGMADVKAYANSIGAKLDIDTTVGSGTTVFLNMKI